MFINFKSSKELVLIRIYEKIYSSDDQEYFFVSEIRQLCADEFSTIFTRKIIADLIHDQTLSAMFFDDDSETGYTITAKGIAAAERYIAKQSADLVAVPAADRMVGLGDNRTDTANLIEALENAADAVRASNTVPEQEKWWIQTHIQSGIDLLKKGKAVTLSAVRSLFLSPLNAAWKAVAEDNLRKAIEIAVKAIRVWIGY